MKHHVLTATALVGLVGACSSSSLVQDSITSNPPPESSTVDSTKLAEELITQLFGLRPYGAEVDAVLTSVTESWLHKCMEERGYEYSPLLHEVDPAPDVIAAFPLLPTEDDVAEKGYVAFTETRAFSTSDSVNQAAVEANEVRRTSVAGWFDALGGPDGCGALVESEVARLVEFRAMESYQALAPTIVEALQSAEFLHAEAPAVQLWAECMKSAGYSFDTPADAVRPYLLERQTAPSDAEVQQALADLGCRESSRLREAVLLGVGTRVRDWFTQHEGDVTELRVLVEREGAVIIQLEP